MNSQDSAPADLKRLVVGLDIGSNLSGVCALDELSGTPFILEHINSSKGKNLWQKADIALMRLDEILKDTKTLVVGLYVEENPQRYRLGISSAKTINIMAKFNALLTYGARKIVGLEPNYISAQSARKLCGIKAKGGQAAKIEAFEWATVELADVITWPVNKKGTPCNWCYDIADAYVIARAGSIIRSRDSDCSNASTIVIRKRPARSRQEKC